MNEDHGNPVAAARRGRELPGPAVTTRRQRAVAPPSEAEGSSWVSADFLERIKASQRRLGARRQEGSGDLHGADSLEDPFVPSGGSPIRLGGAPPTHSSESNN